MKEPNKLLLAGDWHGNSHWAESIIEEAHGIGCDTILQLGDFGFWVPGGGTAEYLDRVQKALDTFDITLYWLDGNHEYHEYLKNYHDWPIPVASNKRPRINYLPRGYQWQWFDKTWMSVGGAVSVDKMMRSDKSWWAEEELTDQQVEYCCRGPVDVIVSHDCPRGVNIPGVGPDTKGGVRGNWPPHILLEAERHREKLRTIWDATGATELYHGHYHIPHRTYFGDGLVVGLDCDGSYRPDNFLVYS